MILHSTLGDAQHAHNMTTQFNIDDIESFETYVQAIEYLRLHQTHLRTNPQEFIDAICNMIIHGLLESLDVIVEELHFDVDTVGVFGSEGATTLVDFACELRRGDIIASALKYGAKKTQLTLKALLLGHGYLDRYDVKECEACLRLLVQYNVPRVVDREVVYDVCDTDM
jgi:hypothetical protein